MEIGSEREGLNSAAVGLRGIVRLLDRESITEASTHSM